jgi:hypothetical protein
MRSFGVFSDFSGEETLMTDTLLDATSRLRQRRNMQEKVDRYDISADTREKLRRLSSTMTEMTQNRLIQECLRERISWYDLVFYIVVERRVPVRHVIEDLRERSVKEERDFLICCESRRFTLSPAD